MWFFHGRILQQAQGTQSDVIVDDVGIVPYKVWRAFCGFA